MTKYFSRLTRGAILLACIGASIAARADVVGGFTSGGFTSGTFTGALGQAVIGRAPDGTLQSGIIVAADDTTPPTVAFTMPTDKAIVNTLTPIRGTASDDTAVVRVDLYVQRKSDNKYFDGTSWTAFSPTASRLATTLTATPTGVSWARTSGLPTGPDLMNGLYALAARAFDAQGNGTSATALVNVDTVLPVVAINSPLDNAAINERPDIRGFASDATGGSGIARVDLLLRRNANGDYWNGTQWSGTTPVFFASTLSGTSWVRDGALPVVNTQSPSNKLTDGTYTVTARAVDRAGNVQKAIINFFVDTAKPLVAITTPSNGARVTSLPRIDGTTSDIANGTGVLRVEVLLRRDRDSAFWNGTAFAPFSSASTLSTTLAGSPGNLTWSRVGGLPTSAQLEPTTYQVTARSIDRAGNVAIALSNITVPQSAGAANTAASPVALSSASAKSDGTIKLTFTGALGAGATDAANYQVKQNGAAAEVLSVQQPVASEAALTCDALTSGARVAVSYDLKDAQGRSIKGTANVVVK